MSPWITAAQEGNRYTRRKLVFLLFLGIGSTLVATRELFVAFVKISAGKAWDGVGDLVAGLLFVLYAVMDFLVIWRKGAETPRQRQEVHEETPRVRE